MHGGLAVARVAVSVGVVGWAGQGYMKHREQLQGLEQSTTQTPSALTMPGTTNTFARNNVLQPRLHQSICNSVLPFASVACFCTAQGYHSEAGEPEVLSIDLLSLVCGAYGEQTDPESACLPSGTDAGLQMSITFVRHHDPAAPCAGAEGSAEGPANILQCW